MQDCFGLIIEQTCSHSFWSCQLQRILVSNIFSGFSVDAVEFTVGFVMLKLEGETISERPLTPFLTSLDV